jgi:hypothetical protein
MQLINDPAEVVITIGFAGLMAYFLMKVGFQDSFYVAGIAGVARILASLMCDVMMDSIYSPSEPEQSTSD